MLNEILGHGHIMLAHIVKFPPVLDCIKFPTAVFLFSSCEHSDPLG